MMIRLLLVMFVCAVMLPAAQVLGESSEAFASSDVDVTEAQTAPAVKIAPVAGPVDSAAPPTKPKVVVTGADISKRLGDQVARINKSLAQKVSEFAYDGPFAGALGKVAKLGGVRIAVDWRALKAAGVSKYTRVRISATDANVEQLLSAVLAKADVKGKPLGWYVGGAQLCVTTQRCVLYRRSWPVARGRPKMPGVLRTVDFQEASLEEVIKFFRGVTETNFYVNWGALKELGVTRETKVTLRLSNISVAAALDLVTAQVAGNSDKYRRVYWVVDKGMVRISTGTVLNGGALRTRTYDVGELLLTPPSAGMPRGTLSGNFVGSDSDQNNNSSQNNNSNQNNSRRRNTSTAGENNSGNDSNNGQVTVRQRRQRTGRDLVAIIRNSIGDEMWEPTGKGSVRILGNRLIISQTPLGFKLLNESLRKR